MTTYLDYVLHTPALIQAVRDGYVRAQKHPHDPTLTIYNYAEKAVYERAWTPEVKAARGLIVRAGQVVARPWPKFFNHTEPGAPDLSGAPVEITEKFDGSLGILYPLADGLPALATRGSFASDQAVHGTKTLRERYIRFTSWKPIPGWTYLFEIIYPGNRIVLDYGNRDEVVLLGAVEISTGLTAGPSFDHKWPGPRAQVFYGDTLEDALKIPPRPNAEGVVVRAVDGSNRMVKLKQADYVELHRIVTGLSERTVWEHLVAHDNKYDELIAGVPEELHEWVTVVANVFLAQYYDIRGSAYDEHLKMVDYLGRRFERRDYAKAVSEHPLRPLLFLILDGKDPGPAIWKRLRPTNPRRARTVSEDTA